MATASIWAYRNMNGTDCRVEVGVHRTPNPDVPAYRHAVTWLWKIPF